MHIKLVFSSRVQSAKLQMQSTLVEQEFFVVEGGGEAYMEKLEDNVQELILSLHHVSPRDETYHLIRSIYKHTPELFSILVSVKAYILWGLVEL